MTAQRTIRTGKSTTQAKTKKTEEQALRSADVILAAEGSTEELAAGLRPDELAAILQTGAQAEAQIKALKATVDKVKALLKANASQFAWKDFVCDGAVAKISASSTSTTGTATEFARILKAEGRLELFDQLVKVQIGEAKKYLGEAALNGFVTTVTDPYGRISIKLV